MYFNSSELGTILRALIIYEKSLPYGLRNKGFFIDPFTLKTDIQNTVSIETKLRRELQ